MATFVDNGALGAFYSAYFNGMGVVNPPANMFIAVLDAAKTDLTGAARLQFSPTMANWQTINNQPDCAGNTTGPLRSIGVKNVLPIVLVPPAGVTWNIKYVSIFSAQGPGGTELVRLELDAPITRTSTQPFTIAAGDLKILSQFLV